MEPRTGTHRGAELGRGVHHFQHNNKIVIISQEVGSKSLILAISISHVDQTVSSSENKGIPVVKFCAGFAFLEKTSFNLGQVPSFCVLPMHPIWDVPLNSALNCITKVLGLDDSLSLCPRRAGSYHNASCCWASSWSPPLLLCFGCDKTMLSSVSRLSQTSLKGPPSATEPSLRA